MKNTLFTIFASVVASAAVPTAASAQSMSAAEAQSLVHDGYNFISNNYFGTARSMALGNAMTALGGDPGSLTLNPAGSAVAPYSTVSITPSISLSAASGSFASDSHPTNYKKAAFNMPNIGFVFNFDSQPGSISRVSLGFVANSSNIYNDGIYAWGRNSESSFGSSLAYEARGIAITDGNPYAAGYRGYVGRYSGGFCDAGFLPIDYYIGAADNWESETNSFIPQPIEQSYVKNLAGSKTDYLINMGFSIEDKLFLGANVGVVDIKYSRDESINESAEQPQKSDVFYKNSNYQYTYSCRGNGIYAKLGVIWLPVAGLRVGAAIQTPTAYNFTERFEHYMKVNCYTDASCSALDNSLTGRTSPQSTWEYHIVSPFSFNLGVAYTIGKLGLISLDYERTNYSNMEYHTDISADVADMNQANAIIRGNLLSADYCLRSSNAFRAGLEVKPVDALALRAGYSFTSGAEATRTNGAAFTPKGDSTQVLSLGIGYDSPGSFFADFSFLHAWRPQEYINGIYSDYYAYQDGYHEDDLSTKISAPRVSAKRTFMNFALTLGWRF